MSFNILLISGHTSGHNKMANGSRNEGDLNIEVVKLLKPRLENLENVKVYAYPTACDAFVDIQKGVFTKRLPIPASQIDYVLECHFNAFNGKYNNDGKKKGSEIFVTTREKGIKVEQAIMRHMNNFFPLRDNDGVFDGVKRTNFLVINTLKSMGVSGSLLETCFYDDEDDMKVYYANKEKIADGIVAGIAEGFGLKKKEGNPTGGNTGNVQKPAPSQPSGGGYTGNSVIEYLNSIGKDSSFAARKKYAAQYGITGYTGTASQNLGLLNKMRGGNSPAAPQTSASYYNKYTGKSAKVDEVLAAVGVPAAYRGSWTKRRTVATKNGITAYVGTATQNNKLISLAKSGKLKRV